MFKNEYRGGPYLEIFSGQGKDPVSHWKLSNPSAIKKAYDKEVKSFIYSLEGSASTTKMQIPKDSKQNLTLVHRYLIFQVFIPKGPDFSIELGLTDLCNNKRRLFFSTAHKEISMTPLHAKIPLANIRKATWLNLCLDMVSFISEAWKGQTFKAIESITISANCKLRRIFSMKSQPEETLDDDSTDQVPIDGELDVIPRSCQLPIDVNQQTKVLKLSRLRPPEERQRSGDITNRSISASDLADLSSSGRKTHHIAFGSKVPVPVPSVSVKKPSSGSKDGISSTRSSKISHSKSHSEDSITSFADNDIHHNRLHHDSGTDSSASRQSENHPNRQKDEKQFCVAPHPPREPREGSGDRGRRRIRVKVVEESVKSQIVPNDFPIPKKLHSSSEECEDGQVSSKVLEDSGCESNVIPVNKIPGDKVVESDDVDDDEEQEDDDEDSVSEVIAALRKQVTRLSAEDNDIDSDDVVNKYEDSEEEIEVSHRTDDSDIYMFHSKPKATPKKTQTDDPNSQSASRIKKTKVLLSTRGAHPEDDFYSSNSSDEERHYHSSKKISVSPKDLRIKSPSNSSGRNKIPRHAKSSHSPSYELKLNKTDQNSVKLIVSPPQTLKSPSGSQSRHSISKKSLREIPKSDARLSQLSENHKAYDHSKYQIGDITESFEKQMLESLKRQAEDENLDEGEGHQPDPNQMTYGHDASSSSSEEDTTSFSTWRGTVPNLGVHHYQDEMLLPSSRASQDTLGSSNPRDWSGVFSPPIVLPSEIKKPEDLSDQEPSPRKSNMAAQIRPSVDTEDQPDYGQDIESDGEDELDLLYDPCLNCYFDPKTCKYYELV